ncbi:MAG: glutamyl-tRNA reductase, partial [Halobacteriota archaeon]
TQDQVRRAMQRRNGHPLVIIDIANPRDVEEAAATIDKVELHNIDDLRKITEENLKKRRSEIGKVVAIINKELNLLEEQYKKARANELIASLYQSAEELRIRELEKAHKRMQSADDLRNYQQILDDLTTSIVNKLLFELTASLREAAANDDDDLMRSAHKLFKREGD